MCIFILLMNNNTHFVGTHLPPSPLFVYCNLPIYDRVLCLLLWQHLDDLLDVPLRPPRLGEHELNGEGEAGWVEAHEGEVVHKHRDQGVGAQQLYTTADNNQQPLLHMTL